MRPLILLTIGLAAAAPAAERKLFVSSFDRLRVDGPFQVTVATGRSPAGSIAGDPRQLDGVEVQQQGNTVYVRRSAAGRDAAPRTVTRQPAAGQPVTGQPVTGQPVTVTLATPSLAAAFLIGAGSVAVTGMKAGRVDLSVAGTGQVAVTGADAGELHATTIGSGRIAVAGRTGKARLIVNGAGGVQADALAADELLVRLDGPGEVAARARYTADVTNTGLGRVAVAGTAKCLVKAAGGGPVSCGVGK